MKTVLAVVVAGLVLFLGCIGLVGTVHGTAETKTEAAVPPPAGVSTKVLTDKSFFSGIHVVHDEDRGVTCWVYSLVKNGVGGISCLPDSSLTEGPHGQARRAALAMADGLVKAYQAASIEQVVTTGGEIISVEARQ